MRRVWISILLAALGATAAGAQTIQVDKNNRTIAITASASATAEADIAIVNVGFQIYAPDADSTYRRGSELSNAILPAVQKTGVSDSAIESNQQNLTHTDFSQNDKATPQERAQKQFTLSQSWRVHTSAKDAATVLHAAIAAGANESGNIDWDLADHNALQAKAAQKALVRAQEVANQMAAGLNIHLGPLIYASNQSPMPRPVMLMSKAATAGQAASAPPSPLAIRPQQIEESATVYAVFSVE